MFSLRLGGFSRYFSFISLEAQSIWYQPKTVSIHPILLRMYTTIPVFEEAQEFKRPPRIDMSNFVQLYHFALIVGSLCNGASPFASSSDTLDGILMPFDK